MISSVKHRSPSRFHGTLLRSRSIPYRLQNCQIYNLIKTSLELLPFKYWKRHSLCIHIKHVHFHEKEMSSKSGTVVNKMFGRIIHQFLCLLYLKYCFISFLWTNSNPFVSLQYFHTLNSCSFDASHRTSHFLLWPVLHWHHWLSVFISHH